MYRFPGTNLYSSTYLTPSASSGVYTYKDSSGNTQSKDGLALAAANQAPAGTRAYTSTVDPTFAKTYALMQSLGANEIVKDNRSSNDYNTP